MYSIKIQILICYHYTFLTDVMGRSCESMNRKFTLGDHYLDSRDYSVS